MEDDHKTREQLIAELNELRRQVAAKRELEDHFRDLTEKYHLVADFASNWEYWLGTDGRFYTISPSVEQITGYSPADFTSDPELLMRIIHPDDRSRFSHHVDGSGQSAPPRFCELEFRIITKSNALVWIEHHCQTVYGQDGSYAGQRASNRDVSLRKKTEEALQTTEKQLRALLEASGESVFLMNLDGTLLMANDITVKRMNTDMETLTKGNLYDFLPPAVAEGRRKNVQHVIETGQPCQFEDERFGRTILNSIYPVLDDNNQVKHLAVFGIDITERKKMEGLVRESEERYRSLFQNSHATLLVIDPEDGRIMDANPAACAYYGYSLSELQGKRITDINALTPEQVFAEMMRAKTEERKHFFFNHRLANGEIRPVEVYSGPVRFKGKTLLYSIVHDISERMKAEAERERLILDLQNALSQIKTLSGLLPICASCKKIRDDQGYWNQIESYISEHSQAEFSHSICPECVKKLYPEYLTVE